MAKADMGTNLHTTAGDTVFSRVFDSVQMCFYYSLYYDFDFSTQQIKNLNKFLHIMNETVTEDDVTQIYNRMKNNLGIDTYELAQKFPTRVKLAMFKRKMKANENPMVLMKNASDAVDLICIFMFWQLHEHYRFSADKLRELWDCVLEASKLYSNPKYPLNDKHFVMYFRDQCGLEVDMKG